MAEKPLWTCPRCGRRFTRPGQSHACGAFSVPDHLKGKTPHAVALYRRFEQLAMAVGDVVVAPAKTRIGFQRRRIFAAVNRIAAGHIDVHIVTSRPIDSPRVRRIDALAPDCYVNHLRITSTQELDAELAAWLKQGYAWGGAD